MSEDGGRPLSSEFRGLLVAAGISNLGDGIRLSALPLLAVTLTDSAFLIAAVTAAQFLPWLVFGPVAGVIVDRAERRSLILRTQVWRGFVMVGLGIAVLADQASIWMVFAVAFVITLGEMLVDPSIVAMVPTVVDRSDIDRANGQISSVELATNDLIGVPVGAGAFASVAWLPFLLDGISYLSSVALFRRLPRTPKRDRPPLSARQALAEAPEGLRFLRGHRMLAPWTAAIAVFNLGSAAGFSLLVVLVIDVHGGSEIAFGATLTAAGVAGVAGASLAPRLVRRLGRGPVLLTCAFGSAAVMAALSIAPALWFVVVVWGVGGALSGTLLAIGRGFVQRHCPDDLIGRAAIASRTITRTSFVIGALAGGTLATASGPPVAFAAGAAVQAAALPLMALAFRHDD